MVSTGVEPWPRGPRGVQSSNKSKASTAVFSKATLVTSFSFCRRILVAFLLILGSCVFANALGTFDCNILIGYWLPELAEREVQDDGSFRLAPGSEDAIESFQHMKLAIAHARSDVTAFQSGNERNCTLNVTREVTSRITMGIAPEFTFGPDFGRIYYSVNNMLKKFFFKKISQKPVTWKLLIL